MNATFNPVVHIGKPIRINDLRNYILDAGISDVDTILMNPADFDELALEYKETYKERLPEPYLLLSVLIRPGNGLSLKPGSISVLENDTDSIRERMASKEEVDPYRIIFRCGYCGRIVDEHGGELDPDQLSSAYQYLNKFSDAQVEHTTGYCCIHGPDSSARTPPDMPAAIDYSLIAHKPLMELTEGDFSMIDLPRFEIPQFPIIYACRNSKSTKIYFTPNENSYSLRGFMLEEEMELFTTADLIQAIQDWRKF